uniref:Protein Iojap-related, mitochondrial n=1 Tax=Zea mays TaxID=4577 RepID=A0A804N450_MAIZE
MLSAVRCGALRRWRPPPHLLPRILSSSFGTSPARPQVGALLELPEVEKVLRDVRAGDVRVFPVGESGLHGGACADYMVVATGRSDWHVRNIAQALLYKARTPWISFPLPPLERSKMKIKQKQKGSDRILMPSVEGQQAGKWVVIDSGSIIIHALEERAREYYDLESIWSKEVSPNTSIQELETSLVKTRRRNLSQKPMKSI